MNSLKKTGIAVMAGGLVGGFATVALGANELYGVGDMGNFNTPMPDGNADCVIINTDYNTIDILYMDNNGLNSQDTSGELVDITVDTAGEGYGQNVNGTQAILKFIANESPLAALDDRVYAPGWYVWANVNNNNTGGTGGTGYYQLDGPAGGYFYAGSGRVYGTNRSANYYSRESIGMINITNGGTGYVVGNNDSALPMTGINAQNYNTATALQISVTNSNAGSIGSFGFPTAVNNGAAFDPSSDAPRDFLAAPTAGLQPGGALANGAGIGCSAFDIVNSTNATMWIFNDNGSGAKTSSQAYGNYRLYLGHTPPQANGTAIEAAGWDLANAAGEVCALDIVQNSTPDTRGDANSNGTSGIGYKAGNFMIYDADGNEVTDVTISYTVDAAGRVYSDALGGFRTGAYGVNIEPTTGGPIDAAMANGNNTSQGYTITAKGSGYRSSAGWTVVPQGNGFGFDCGGVHLWGQVVSLPYMACLTDGSANAWDVVAPPVIEVEAGAGIALPAAADRMNYTTADVPTGKLEDGYVLTAGESYTTATTGWITTQPADSGTNGSLRGVIGGVGRTTVSYEGAEVTTDLFNNGFMCYMNGDFNGDGYSDLLWHSDEAGVTAIWNMGAEGNIMSAGFVDTTGAGAGWSLAGIGKFGWSGTGCCLLWHNTLDGQSCVWVVDSSAASDADWVRGGVFLPTVETLTYTPRATNNVVQNGGSNVYWQDSVTGQMSCWPVAVNDNITSGSTAGAGVFTLDGAEILFPAEYATNIAGAGNMAGRPVSASNSLRDIVLANGYTGETLVWLMGDNGYAIDTAAVGGGGGFTTRGGMVTVDNFYNFRGVGQYKQNTIYALTNAGFPLPGGTSRETWFADLFWSLPDAGANFSWKMDRNIDLLDYRGATTTGTGISVDPYEVAGSQPIN